MKPWLINRLVNPPHAVDDAALRAAVQGRVVLVTGASHGIGRATAQRLAAAGAQLLLVARSADVLEEVAEATGGRAFVCDLCDPDAVAALVPQLQAAHGHVDIVVSNAGKSIRRSVADSADRAHDLTRTIGVNYLGPAQLLLGLLPGMRERGSGQIVNVSTIGVLVPPAPRWGAYAASKSAFDVWLRSAAAEIAADGIAVSTLYLALVHTRMSAPTGDFDNVPGLSPEQAAGVVCRAIVRRPSMVAPWWGRLAGGLADIARGPSEAYSRHYGSRIGKRSR